MNKKVSLAFILLLIIFAAANASALKDVAYVLEDNSQISGNILNAINELGLSYDIVRDSKIPTTDFSQYSLLLITENVNYRNLLPLNEKSAVFFDRKIAEQVWPVTPYPPTGSTTARDIKITALNHEIFEGIQVPLDWVINVYSSSGSIVHYLNAKPSYVQTLAIKTTEIKPVIAVSTRVFENSIVSDVFFGLPEADKWSANAITIFKNSLTFVLADVDQDEDGWIFEEDCNDKDPSIHPEANEIPYDNIDQDCDGYDSLDADSDGYCADGQIISNALFQCIHETGFFGTDCDDEDNVINPGNPDPYLNCINDAPQIINAPNILVFSEGELVTFEVTAIDPEDDELYYEINDSRFSVEGNVFSWQTTSEDLGTHSFEITVSDGEFSAGKTITIIISDINIPPVSSPIPNLEWTEDTNYSINLYDYFSDADSFLEFGVEEHSENSNIAIVFQDDGIVSFVPSENFFGEKSVIFYAEDEESKILSNEVRLIVTPVNDPVEFNHVINNFTWNEDTALENAINLYEHFSDVDSSLEFEAFGNEHVGITINNGLVSFYSEKDFSGTEEIYFTATDGQFTAVSNNILLTVNEVGEPPEFHALNCESEIEEDKEYNCVLEASDFENDVLEFSVLSSENLICEVSGNVLTYVSEKDYNGEASCALEVSDIDGTDSQTLEVNVLPVNDAPEIISYTPTEDTVRLLEGSSKTFSVRTADVDSNTITSWFLSGELKANTTSRNSEFTFFGENVGTYSLKAEVSDTEQDVSRLWNIVVGPISNFTCSEVGGYICSERKTCAGDFLGVKDSDSCCATECIPSFRDAGACNKLDSNLTVELNSQLSDDEIELGATIKPEFKIWNNLKKDQDVKIEAHLYNLDKDRSEAETDGKVTVKADKSKIIRLELTIPEDLNLENRFVLFVKVSDKVCNQNYFGLEIKRPEKKVIISKFELPKTAVCGESVTAEIRTENVGSRKQDVVLSVTNRALNIDGEASFSLEEYGEEYKETKEFEFVIPEDIESGVYKVTASADYGTADRVTEIKEIEIDCQKEQVRESNLRASEIGDKIILNQLVQQAKTAGSADDKKFVLVAVLFMFNLLLVTATLSLYLTAAKKKKAG